MRKAFTLIELAIVVAVIALLASVTLIGVRVSEHAKIRSFSQEFSLLEISIRGFKDTYLYIPGDFPNATDFFSSATSADNGNGNNVLDINAQSQAEISRIANHLAWSEMLLNLDKNSSDSFASKIFALGHFEFQKPCAATNGLYNDADFADTVIFHNISGSQTWTPAISASQAYKTDLKIDDGRAATGKIRAFVEVADETLYNCVAAATACNSASSSTDYIKTNKNLGCALALGLNQIFKN